MIIASTTETGHNKNVANFNAMCNPKARLDIIAKNATGISSSAEGILLPRVDRQRAQSMSGLQTSTLIYVNNISTGTQTGTAANIDSTGYYYFSGSNWVKLNSGTSTASNIYNSNGSLTGNRTVQQGANTLAITGSAINAVSVDGNTFSVDAANNRVGIGTTNPQNQLHIATGSNDGKKLALFNNAAGTQFYGFGAISGNVEFHAHSAPTYNPAMVINSSQNVGIGTMSPQALLDLSSTSKGFLPPRMTTAQRDLITKVPGLMIYNTTVNCMQNWNSSIWVSKCAGTISSLACGSPTNSGTLTGGTMASEVNSVISYTGGNGGTHNGQTVASTGVTGLTAKLEAGSFANGPGTLIYTITGIPSGGGTASFAINIGGQTCTLTRTVVAGQPPAPDTSIDCTGWTVSDIGTSSGNVNGQSVSATVTATGMAKSSNASGYNCLSAPYPGISMKNFGFPKNKAVGSSSTITIKFNKNVSNIKLITFNMTTDLHYSVIIKRNGIIIVNPTASSVGLCTNVVYGNLAPQTIGIYNSNATSTNVFVSGINIGGNWFDEIQISGVVDHTLTNGDTQSYVAVCVGDVQ